MEDSANLDTERKGEHLGHTSADVLPGERRGKLAELHGLLGEARAGAGRLAVVTGPAGSGKTLLLRTFYDDAARSGTSSLSATASRAARSVPFAVLEQLFRGARGHVPAEPVGRILRLLDEGASASLRDCLEPGASDRIGAHVFHRVCMALLDLMDETEEPLVIGIDDAQHADTASLQILFAVLRRLHTGRLLLVLAESETSQPLDVLLKAELPSEPVTRRLRLGPLPVADVEELLAPRLGRTAARRKAAAYRDVSGGSPLLVRALLDDDRRARPDDQRPAADRAYREAVLTCLYRCGSDLLDFARQLALLGDTFDRTLLHHLVGLDSESTQRAIDVLRAAGILGGDRFRHSQARVAVLGDMTPEERSDAYARAARILHKNGAPATAVAVQLLASEQIGTSCSVTLLQEAADQAMGDGQVHLAQDILHYADLHPADRRQQAVTTAMLVRTEWLTDPTAAARWVPDLMVAAEDGQLASGHVSTLIGALLWFGKIDAALDHLGRLRDPDWSRDPLTAAHRHARSKWLTLLYPPAAAALGERDRDASTLRTDLPFAADPQSQVAELLADLMSCAPGVPGAQAAERTLRRYPFSAGTAAALAAALVVLVLCGRLSTAARWAEGFAVAAEERDLTVWHAVFTALAAEIALRRGALEQAERFGRSALGILPAEGWGVLIGLPIATLLQARTELGRLDQAQELLNLPVPDVMSHTTAGLPYLRARGRYHLACGQPEPALADFLTVGNQLKEWGLDLPAFLPWRTDAAEALLRLGRVHDAAELAEEQRELTDRRQPYVHALSLRVLAACRPLDRRTELLREALKTLQQVEAPLELAQAKADLAAALQELGRHDEGRLLLYQSRYLAEEAGVQAPGRTVALEPALASAVPAGRGPGGITAVKELSDAERRVARLAARGLSNRQIAGELFLTVSTVEQHLTRVYRKLKVRGRSELSQAVPADPPRKTAARGQESAPGRPDSSCASVGGRRAR